MDQSALIGIVLLIAGFVFVGIEMVLPGFSIPGVSGIACLIIGVFLLADTPLEAAFFTVAILAVLGILMALILWLLSKGKLRTPIILEDEQKRADGYLSSSDLNYLLGRQGVASTDLRPAGVATFDDVNFDVFSDGSYISAGTPVEIIKVEGSRLLVKERKRKAR